MLLSADRKDTVQVYSPEDILGALFSYIILYSCITQHCSSSSITDNYKDVLKEIVQFLRYAIELLHVKRRTRHK